MKTRSKFVAAIAAFALTVGVNAFAQSVDSATHDQHASQATQKSAEKSAAPSSDMKPGNKMMQGHGKMSDADHQKMMQQHMNTNQDMMQKNMSDHKGMSQPQ